MMNEHRNIHTIMNMKKQNSKITAITAYDYSFAKIFDEADIDIILVGDSVGMVCSGYDSTFPVTLEDMIYHTKAVRRGVKNAMLIADMPFMSYQASIDDAIRNAGRLVKEGGAEGVKLEGGAVILEVIDAIVEIGIPVMAHIGLTPQYKNMLGGYKVQGKNIAEYQNLMDDAKAVEEAGAFSVVLEGVPDIVSKKITNMISIPTIGIGAGAYCDGQIMVSYDILGLTSNFSPKYLKRYLDGDKLISEAIKKYANEVRGGNFPSEEHSYHVDKDKIHLFPVPNKKR